MVCNHFLERFREQGIVEVPSEEQEKILALMAGDVGQQLNGRQIQHILDTAVEIAEAEEFEKRKEDPNVLKTKPKLSAETVLRVTTEMTDVYGFLSK